MSTHSTDDNPRRHKRKPGYDAGPDTELNRPASDYTSGSGMYPKRDVNWSAVEGGSMTTTGRFETPDFDEDAEVWEGTEKCDHVCPQHPAGESKMKTFTVNFATSVVMLALVLMVSGLIVWGAVWVWGQVF